jgi:photosystem II stability/assembly factor-like uncharacterized protein
MGIVNEIKHVVAAMACCLLLVSCSYEVKSTAPDSRPSVSSSEPAKASKQGKFKLNEIGDLPGRGWAGTVRLQFLNKQEGWFYNFNHLWHTSDGGKTWVLLFDVSSDITAGYSFVQFINAQVGWRQKIDRLEKTTDGGHTWEKVATPFKPDEGEIFSVKFLPDGRRGWLTGGVYRSLDQSQYGELPVRSTNADGTKAIDGAVFYTEDSGRTWRRQPLTAILGEIVVDVTTTPTGKAWTFAGYDTFYLEGSKWKKIDYKRCGGDNQMLMESVAKGDEQGDRYKPLDIFFIDDSQGWLSFANGYIAKTNDGGKTWCDLYNLKKISSGIGERLYFNKIHFTDAANGLGLGNNGILFETSDGGANWNRIEGTAEINDIQFDGENMWAASKAKLFQISF